MERSDQPEYIQAFVEFAYGSLNGNAPLPDQVMPALLAPAINPLISRLARRTSTDHRLPARLRKWAGQRKNTLLLSPDVLDTALAVLLEEPAAPAVDELRRTWLDHSPMRVACETGEAYAADFLRETLTDASAVQTLATTLWALGLDDPARQVLFGWLARAFSLRCRMDQAPHPTPAASNGVEGAQLTKLRERLKEKTASLNSTKNRLRAEQAKAKRLQKQQETSTRNVRDLESEVKRLKATDPKGERALQKAATDLAQARRRASEAEATSEKAARKLKRAEERIEALQEELKKRLEDLSLASKHRAKLSGELSSALERIKRNHRRYGEALPDREVAKRFIFGRIDSLAASIMTSPRDQREAIERRVQKWKKVRRDLAELDSAFEAPRPVPLVRHTPVRYRGFGGATEIGASAYLVQVGDERILVDCGIRVGRHLDQLAPSLGGLGRIDAIVLTHAHADHVGWLPALVKQIGDVPVYATPETRDLIEVMLRDSAKHMTRMANSRRLAEQNRGIASSGFTREPYGHDDVDATLLRVRDIPLGGAVELAATRISLHPAGHILGAASVLVEGENRKVALSGDFAPFAQRTVGAGMWPESMHEADLLVLESTYGSDTHPVREKEEALLVERVARLVQAGEIALLPCFALGRAQEVLSILAEAMKAGRCPSFPVWIDGMIYRVNDVYRRYDRLHLGENFHEIRPGSSVERSHVIEHIWEGPGAIVATSGMLAGGPMVEYVEKLAGSRRARILFSGYTDEESPGRKLLNGHTTVDIEDERTGRKRAVKIAVPPERICLSAHADQMQLLDLCLTAQPRNVVLVHGENDMRAALARELRREGLAVASDSTAFDLE